MICQFDLWIALAISDELVVISKSDYRFVDLDSCEQVELGKMDFKMDFVNFRRNEM